MAGNISKRLLTFIDALPLHEGMRVLEIGCGTGVAAREIASRFGNIYILGIDRSHKAVQQSIINCKTAGALGKTSFIRAAIEDFTSCKACEPFDLAFAIRVGVLDGRHPDKEPAALKNIVKMLRPAGKLYIDGGTPLKEISIESYRKEEK